MDRGRLVGACGYRPYGRVDGCALGTFQEGEKYRGTAGTGLLAHARHSVWERIRVLMLWSLFLAMMRDGGRRFSDTGRGDDDGVPVGDGLLIDGSVR